MTNQKNIFVDQSSRLSKLKQQTISSGKKHYLPKYENSNNVINKALLNVRSSGYMVPQKVINRFNK